MKKKLITFKVTDHMLQKITEMMEEANFDSRSELVRDALAEFLLKECESMKNKYERLPESIEQKLRSVVYR